MEQIAKSWVRSLKARNLSPATIRVYESNLRVFLTWLNGREVDRWTCEEFIAEQVETKKAYTAICRYRVLKQFFDWCVEEEELPGNPMRRIKQPAEVEVQTAIFSGPELKAMMDSCRGRQPLARRDFAILSLLIDTGIRRSELTGLVLDDLDLEAGVILVFGKGRKRRIVPFGDKTAAAIDRYLRVRDPEQDSLFGLTQTGLDKMIRRIGRESGVTNAHLHRFRHTFAHHFLDAGGSEGDLMSLAGWRSRNMLARYGASAASLRARKAYRSPLDHL